MALIECPNCGKSVSESAVKCVHCDYPLKGDLPESEAEKSLAIRCPECGEEVPTGSEVCQKCGYPVASQPFQEEANRVADSKSSSAKDGVTSKVKGKTLLMVIAGAVLVLAVVAIGFAVSARQEQARQQEEQARLEAEAAARKQAEDLAYNQYIDDMVSAMYLMISGATDAETLGNTTCSVWRAAIFEDSQESWDEEIRQYYAEDFNDALSMLYADSAVVDQVASIEANRKEVDELYRKLQNPPEGLASAYSAFEELYDTYLSLTRLATSPTGSYQSFTDEFSRTDTECAEAFEKLQAKIPEKR